MSVLYIGDRTVTTFRLLWCERCSAAEEEHPATQTITGPPCCGECGEPPQRLTCFHTRGATR